MTFQRRSDKTASQVPNGHPSAAKRRAAKRQAGHRRSLRCEALESRRLLAAEGSVYDWSGVYDASGLAGSVSAEVDWGDGTVSPPTSISGGETSSQLKVRFDYSLDSSNFFSGDGFNRRALLDLAAESLVGRFADDLAAIVPGGVSRWQPSVFHPSSGPANQSFGTLVDLSPNLSIPENEIIVYVGARDLPGNRRGVGGGGQFSFPATDISCQTQAECDQQVASIEAFRNTVRTRGEAGAARPVQTDVAPAFGSISFDSETNWFFGVDAEGIQSGQSDFVSFAFHELAHVLGFGAIRTDLTSSWANLTRDGAFSGPAAQAAYEGAGQVPVEDSHWADVVSEQIGQATVMSAAIYGGVRQLFSPLDFAAMDDLGWELIESRTTVAASHVYPDNGSYPVRLMLKGSGLGELVYSLDDALITNVAPTLTPNANAVAEVGKAIDLTNIGQIADPGFANGNTIPGTVETFEFSIDWGDDSDVDTGIATIDSVGDASGALTLASFDSSHTYMSAGTRTVTLRVTDDDGATVLSSFTITVEETKFLSAEFDSPFISESNDSVVRMTVQRFDSEVGEPLEVQIDSVESGQLDVPSVITIPANQQQVIVEVFAVDDSDPEPTKTVVLGFQAAGYPRVLAEIQLLDNEQPLFQNSPLIFDVNNNGTVTASDALRIINQLAKRGAVSQLDPEVEQPNGIFLDTNGDYRITAVDALRVINELSRRSGASAEPESLFDAQRDVAIDTAITLLF
ncbi:MAG: dockerin type I domain-containing protein [Rubripirellula sp.]|nr:dockerin type I domain-containing protein [Rubripirellula sp.]